MVESLTLVLRHSLGLNGPEAFECPHRWNGSQVGAGTGRLGRVGVCLGTNPTVRRAVEGDLEQLLELYRHLHTREKPPALDVHLRELWSEMLADRNLHVLVAEKDRKLIATRTLVLARNLTRGARPFGLIENVVTPAELRRKGYGKYVVGEALKIAWQNGCYKVMLLMEARLLRSFTSDVALRQGSRQALWRTLATEWERVRTGCPALY